MNKKDKAIYEKACNRFDDILIGLANGDIIESEELDIEVDKLSEIIIKLEAKYDK